jgi:transcriptional regulator with XRE-family HTH domain
MQTGFGAKLRELRQKKGMTLRSLAEAAGVDFTYLSKIENDRLEYLPGAETILAKLAGNANARRFFQRAQEIASPKDWDALLDVLEKRQTARSSATKKGSE